MDGKGVDTCKDAQGYVKNLCIFIYHPGCTPKLAAAHPKRILQC